MIRWTVLAACWAAACPWTLAQTPAGTPVSYQLPADGPLPRTYLVTLAIVDVKEPGWIISQFVRGEPRTVTAENGGKFTELWDGLDDNLMPVPPGTYGVKGISTPARKWRVDGEYHAITPRFVAGASSWMPTPQQWNVPEPFGGDPCEAPLADVDVGANGVAVFYYTYLENGTNNPMFDLRRPVGLGQFLRSFPSGGAGGGTSTCTDGHTVWSFSTDGGPKYVYRADGKPFGTGRAQRTHIYLPQGWVKGMACRRDQAAQKTFVYVAQGGRIEEIAQRRGYVESDRDRVDVVSVHDGDDGAVIAEVPLSHPKGIAARGSGLYALHGSGADWAVSFVPLEAGLPKGPWQRLFGLPAGIEPGDVEVDSHGRIYVSDTAGNKVLQLDRAGKILHTYGRLAAQKPGTYDRESFLAPAKLAAWTGTDGQDRLLVVENAGPNRVSEWDADGRMIRDFLSLQTHANGGYAVDPEHPEQVYVAGQQGWLTRFLLDYGRGTWTVDAVWPNVGTDPQSPGFDHPQFLRVGGRSYLACGRSNNVYRLEGDRWLLSAAIIRQRKGNDWQYFTWHDANGDGVVEDDEYRGHPLEMPGWLLRYHGNQWSDDLSLVALNQAGPDVWRLAPEGFDGHGNPIFKSWQKLLTDPIFAARAAGTADALHGGNELAEKYASDWAMADGGTAEGYYVFARGGKSFSANEGAQGKLSRYVPDGRGGYRLVWRTGRIALQGVAQRGEIYGAIHVWKPIHGLVSLVDQSRCGVLLYTEDGLYVDTIFPDPRRFPRGVAGIYPQPGEFFAGYVYPNRTNGRIYFAMGKFTPLVFEAEGWSLAENPVRPLAAVQERVELAASRIAVPPEIAISVRGGAGAARVARFAPAIGGAVLDGSMAGWESCEPVQFQSDRDQSVEVRCLYDPEQLYLRWHARLATKVDPKPLAPVERLFAHDRGADTLSFYIQGDPNARPGPADGRPGDVRLVFGLFRDGGEVRPVALGMYPAWRGPGKANPITYRTPVGKVEFARVALLPEVRLNAVTDEDGRGFVLSAAIPRAAIPGLPAPGSALRTMVNFEATLGGHNKFWWSNADGSANRETYDEPTEARLYPGSWSPAVFQGLDRGVVVRHWQLCGPFGGPGAELFQPDLRGKLPGTERDAKQAAREFCEAAQYPPDEHVDLAAVYTGEMLQGYWGKPAKVTWQRATVADLDTRVTCGPSAQVWYGAAWIRAAEDVELEFQFQGHPQTSLRWFLRGEKVWDGEIPGDDRVRAAGKTLTLRKGWNEVKFRGYCVGYPPFRAGLVLAGPPEKLWRLRLSAAPPEAIR